MNNETTSAELLSSAPVFQQPDSSQPELVLRDMDTQLTLMPISYDMHQSSFMSLDDDDDDDLGDEEGFEELDDDFDDDFDDDEDDDDYDDDDEDDDDYDYEDDIDYDDFDE